MKSRWVFVGIILIVIILLIVLSVNFKYKPVKGVDTKQSQDSSLELYVQANNFLDKGEYLQARDRYQKITADFPNSKHVSEAKRKLEDLNIKIIFSGMTLPKETQIYEVKKGDTLEKIAKEFNTTVGLIKKSNNLKSNLIRVNQRFRIWTQEFSCIVDKSQNILILKSGEEIVKTYSVSTGANNSTPVGTFKVINKLISPVWYKSGAVVLPESPDNILGTRWLGFDLTGYGIHGTTQPETIGKQITQGCVRMLNKDVEEIYILLPVGTEVTIID